MTPGHSRRSFLANAAAWTAAAGLGPYLGACEALCEKIRKRPMRRSLATLSGTDPIIQSYRVAVDAMKALPNTDRRNWQRQAQIHQNFCAHGNWFFLPWHRAYLAYFEQICRQLSGNADFALPYWDWTVDPKVPAPFWSGTLLDTTRTVTATSTASSAFIGRPVIDSILAETDFLIFASGVATTQRPPTVYGRLESTPHNYIHPWVGGNMGAFMSPLDPVFWMHHNMIECLWVHWNLTLQNANTNDSTWSQYTFTGNFCDRDGNLEDIQVGTTLLFPLLSYQYDGLCGGGSPGAAPAQADTALRRFLQTGAPPRLEILRRFEVRRAFEVSTEAPVTTPIPVEADAIRSVVERPETERLLLTIAELRQPQQNSFFVRVFINQPDASPTTPIEDPHYAGSFAFFNDPKAMEGHPPGGGGAVIVDVSETVRRLSQAGQLRPGQPVQVRLVAVPIHADRRTRETFGAGRLELALGRVRPKQ